MKNGALSLFISLALTFSFYVPPMHADVAQVAEESFSEMPVETTEPVTRAPRKVAKPPESKYNTKKITRYSIAAGAVAVAIIACVLASRDHHRHHHDNHRHHN